MYFLYATKLTSEIAELIVEIGKISEKKKELDSGNKF